jgi:sugar phosphate permease
VTQASPHPPAVVEATYRRLSWRLVPVLFVAYLVVFTDCYNIGFAQLQMKRAIGMSDAIYGLGASLTLIAQAVFQVPSNLMAGRIGVA